MATWHEPARDTGISRIPLPALWVGALALALVALVALTRAPVDPETGATAGTGSSMGAAAPALPTLSEQARAAGLDRAPRPLAGNPVPAYPRSALRRGMEGDVVLNIVVGTDGRPMDVQIVERAGTVDSAFDRAATEAALQWRFEPAMRDGETVPSTVRLPIEFRRN